MEQIYDVNSMPVRWLSLLGILGVAYVVIFFCVIPPLAHEDVATRRSEQRKGLVGIAIISTIVLVALYTGFSRRYECRDADPDSIETVEGVVANLSYSSRLSQTRFQIGDTQSVERNSALQRPCGFTPSFHDIVNLREGDSIRLEHLRGRKILRAWRMPPAQ